MKPRDDFGEYQAMRAKGDSPETVFRAAEHQHDMITAVRAVGTVFGLSLAEAKEVMIRAHGCAKTLSEHQANLLPALKRVLERDGKQSDLSGSES